MEMFLPEVVILSNSALVGVSIEFAFAELVLVM